MKFALVLIAFVFLASADRQDCVKEHCPNEFNACMSNFKCQMIGLKCYTKCGDDNACYEQCAAGVTNKQFVDLCNCASQYCANSAIAFFQKEQCDVQTVIGCAKQFLQYYQDSCQDGDYQQCFVGFLQSHEQCDCDFGF